MDRKPGPSAFFIQGELSGRFAETDHGWTRIDTDFPERKAGASRQKTDLNRRKISEIHHGKMASEEPGLLYAKESRIIVGCAMAVMNELGHGFREKTYENALRVALSQSGISTEQQPRFPIYFRSVKVDDFVPDLIAEGRIIVDAKTIERITNLEIGQMLNYLRVTGLKLALILNFKHTSLQFRRVVI